MYLDTQIKKTYPECYCLKCAKLAFSWVFRKKTNKKNNTKQNRTKKPYKAYSKIQEFIFNGLWKEFPTHKNHLLKKETMKNMDTAK